MDGALWTRISLSGVWKWENSFGYIASWSEGKELKELRASLETINKTSGELIDNIERNYKEICKERGIDLTAAPKQERDPIEVLAEDIDEFAFDYDPYEYHDTVDAGSRTSSMRTIPGK